MSRNQVPPGFTNRAQEAQLDSICEALAHTTAWYWNDKHGGDTVPWPQAQGAKRLAEPQIHLASAQIEWDCWAPFL